MKIVVAPQSYKGSLSARAVADAMACGIRRVIGNADLVLLPMADGGEGTVDVLVAATGGTLKQNEVTGPLGEMVTAVWGILGDGATAVIEIAAASGLTLVPHDRLDPTVATTYGTGELILAAIKAGCRRLIIGIGGSATNDGGAGMAQALGASLLDDNRDDIPPGGAALARLRRIDITGLDARLVECKVIVASDVVNPLYGEQGASRVYGPQKGATEAMCQQLDEALENYATVIKRDLGIEVASIPGAGAAGGLGAGLIAFLGAELKPGVDIVCEAVGISQYLKEADLVFTGEGRIDVQTMFGKTISGIASRAKVFGVPVIVIGGELAISNDELAQYGIHAAMSIATGPISLEESSFNARELITGATERALRLIMVEPQRKPHASN